MQELGQDESGGPGSDDGNLGTMAFAHVLWKYDNVSVSNVARAPSKILLGSGGEFLLQQ